MEITERFTSDSSPARLALTKKNTPIFADTRTFLGGPGGA